MGNARSDGLDEIQEWVDGVIASLEPAARVKLFTAMGRLLRRVNAKRITQQQDPDGRRWPPRKPRRDQVRRRRKMLLGFRKARHMKVESSANAVATGFEGRTARIARIHHLGLRDRLKGSDGEAGALVRYSRRRLLGLAQVDVESVQQLILDHIDPDQAS